MIVLALSGSTLQAQQYSYKQHVNFADKKYEEKNYLKAIEHYTKALELADHLKPYQVYQLGDAAYQVFSLNIAKQQFQNYLELDSMPLAHDASYKLARINHLEGDYQNAITAYNIYLSEFEEVDTSMSIEALFQISSASWVLSADVESPVDSVNRLDEINTRYSEHSPFKIGDDLYYTSFSEPMEDDELDRLKAKILRDQEEVIIATSRTEDFASHPSFTADGTLVFYSICNYVTNTDINCAIYYSLVNPDSTISSPKRLPDIINVANYTSTQPTVTVIDSVNTLFFSSDRPGSLGKRDIWKTTFNDRMVFTDPVNIKTVNTEQDDITPFYHIGSDALYFSSNGRYGYGNYDLFRLQNYSERNDNVENLGNIINSPHNEIYFFMSDNGSELYFSSNRKGSMYLEQMFETCCYDIYRADVTECKIDLLALIYSAADKTELTGVDIKVIDKLYDEVIFDQTLDSSFVNIDLECDKKYEIITSKDGFNDLSITLDDVKPIYGKTNEITREFYMEPSIIDLNIAVYDYENKSLPLTEVELTILNEDTGENVILVNEDSHIFNHKIKPNTNYKITGKKNAYDDGMLVFYSDSKSSRIDTILYLEKTEIIKKTEVSLKNAIPVRLYFDNDAPDAGTMKESSTVNYSETYYKYYNKKEKFKQVYANQVGPSRRDKAINEMESFFQNNVKAGYDKYENFKNQLLVVLEAGLPVNIYLRGYASPLSRSEYNTALGKRRVDSIRKEFSQWKDGIFIPYLQSGQLVVTERSFGEDTAPPTVSDDPRKPASSIYSPSASIERRVEIDEINFNEN